MVHIWVQLLHFSTNAGYLSQQTPEGIQSAGVNAPFGFPFLTPCFSCSLVSTNILPSTHLTYHSPFIAVCEPAISSPALSLNIMIQWHSSFHSSVIPASAQRRRGEIYGLWEVFFNPCSAINTVWDIICAGVRGQLVLQCFCVPGVMQPSQTAAVHPDSMLWSLDQSMWRDLKGLFHSLCATQTHAHMCTCTVQRCARSCTVQLIALWNCSFLRLSYVRYCHCYQPTSWTSDLWPPSSTCRLCLQESSEVTAWSGSQMEPFRSRNTCSAHSQWPERSHDWTALHTLWATITQTHTQTLPSTSSVPLRKHTAGMMNRNRKSHNPCVNFKYHYYHLLISCIHVIIN